MTAGKIIALTIWTFVGKAMPLLFYSLSRFAIAFLPKSKRLLISRLQLPSTVILELKKIKSVIVSIVSPSICHEVMGKQWKQQQTLFFGAPKSLQIVTAAMKLKDAYSLEGKL